MIKVITPPENEPVTIDDFKVWMQGLPISTEQEPMVASLLKAGREEAEAYQNAAYCEQTLQIALDNVSGAIALPRPPFKELKSVVAYMADGTEQDITDLFEINDNVKPVELSLKYGASLPGPLRAINPVLITYTSGYDAIPEKVKQAILLYAAWAYRNREGGEGIPAAFYNLLSKGRVIPV